MRFGESTFILVLLFCALQAIGQDAARLIPYKTARGWGYSDARGQLKIPPRFTDAHLFVNGRAVVSVSTPGGPVSCVIDATGRYIIPPSWHWNGYLFQGFHGAGLNVQDDAGRWGYADTAGRLLIPFAYDSPMHARGYYFAQFLRMHRGRPATLITARRGRYGLIDTAGRIMVPFAYDLMKRPNEYDNRTAAHWLLVSRGGLWGALDTAGRTLLPILYPDLNVYSAVPGLVRIFDGQRWGCADSAGRLVMPVAYEKVEMESHHGTQPVHFNLINKGLWGWADSTCRIRIEPCSSTELQRHGRYFTGTAPGNQQRAFLLDSTGRTVVPPNDWSIRTSGDTVWVIRQGKDSGAHYMYDEARYDIQRRRIVGRWKRQAIVLPEIYTYVEQPSAVIARHRYWGEDISYKRGEEGRRRTDTFLHGARWYIQTRLYTGTPGTAPLIIVARDTGRDVLYAVMDSVGQARIKPQRDWGIGGTGNWKENWLCAKNNEGQYFAVDTLLQPLLGPVPEPVVERIVWKGKPYWIVRNSQRPVPHREESRHADWEPPCVAVYDHRGQRVQRLEPHCLIKWQRAEENYLPAGEANLLRVQNDEERVGFFHPDGTAAYPAINFRLDQQMKAFSPLVFFGGEKGRSHNSLLDERGRSYAPDAKIISASIASEPSEKTGTGSYAVDRSLLDVQYVVDGTNPDWNKRVLSHFYLGLDGRVYADPDAVRSK